MILNFPDDAAEQEPNPTDVEPNTKHTLWENQPRGGWDEFRRARDLFLLGLAVDSTLHPAPGEQPDV